jgi:hypothetical protein
MNNHQVGCEILSGIAWAMHGLDTTSDGWRDTYLDLWVEFQLRYNYLMPIIPIYIEADHDFYSNRVRGWETDTVWDWRHAVPRAYVAG